MSASISHGNNLIEIKKDMNEVMPYLEKAKIDS